MLIADKLSYKTKQQKAVLDGISLTFAGGTITGILGPNGAGKSSLLKVLSGLWHPTSGVVLWNGENLLNRQRLEISRILSLVPQSPSATFDYTVEEMVAMGRYAAERQASGKSESVIIEEALKKTNTTHLCRRAINEISAGEKQRVYMARALATEAPILLLDEPTANLDIRHQREVWSIIKNLANEQKIIIVSLHDFAAAGQFCDHVAVLSGGKCLAHGKYHDVMTNSLIEKVFFNELPVT